MMRKTVLFNLNLKQALKRVHVVVHPFKMLNKSKIEVSNRNRKMIRQKELRVHPNSKISSILLLCLKIRQEIIYLNSEYSKIR
jgi:hypothetical protein